MFKRSLHFSTATKGYKRGNVLELMTGASCADIIDSFIRLTSFDSVHLTRIEHSFIGQVKEPRGDGEYVCMFE